MVRSPGVPRLAALLVCSLALGPSQTRAAEGDVPDVSLQRLSPRVLVLTFGTSYPTHVVAVSTQKGIVVVDTTFLPSLARKMKALISREFGRDDFAYVISTHYHSDHTTGNVAFPGARVIAHASAKDHMMAEYGDMRAYRDQVRGIMARQGGTLPALEPRSLQYGVVKETNALMGEVLDEIGEGFVFRTPDIEFGGRLHLDMGDLSIDLARLGDNWHTTTDIAIYVPEEQLLMTGDLFAGEWLPALAPSQSVADQIALLDGAFRDYGSATVVVPAHFREYGPEYFRMSADYFEKVLESVKRVQGEGKTLEEAKRELSIESAFPEVAGLLNDFMGTDIHASNIEIAWKELETPRQ